MTSSPNRSNWGVHTITATETLSMDDVVGKAINLGVAGGATVTLPAATGSGEQLRFYITVTATTSYIIQVPDAATTMQGVFHLGQDSADTIASFSAASTSDTITLNGTTTGGLIGGEFTLTDVAANKWHVAGYSDATGTEATPFSAAVS